MKAQSPQGSGNYNKMKFAGRNKNMFVSVCFVCIESEGRCLPSLLVGCKPISVPNRNKKIIVKLRTDSETPAVIDCFEQYFCACTISQASFASCV